MRATVAGFLCLIMAAAFAANAAVRAADLGALTSLSLPAGVSSFVHLDGRDAASGADVRSRYHATLTFDSPLPEPGALAILGLALVAIALRRRRRRSRRRA